MFLFFTMYKFFEIFLGLVFLIVPIYLWVMNTVGFGDAALVFLQGGIMWFLIIIGLVLVFLGISDLRD